MRTDELDTALATLPAALYISIDLLILRQNTPILGARYASRPPPTLSPASAMSDQSPAVYGYSFCYLQRLSRPTEQILTSRSSHMSPRSQRNT